jgi:hypothetical protein
VLGCRLAVRVQALEVRALPGIGVFLEVARVLAQKALDVKIVAALNVAHMPRMACLIRLERNEVWLEPRQLTGSLRHQHAERLPFDKRDGMIPASELPVHREGRDRPVGLDEPTECANAVLGMVGRTANQPVEAGRRPKQVGTEKVRMPLPKWLSARRWCTGQLDG